MKFFNNIGKRLICMSVILILLLGMLTGCGKFTKTKIVLTTGVSGNELFKVGSSVCILPEAMIYLATFQEQYESVYGVEMWSHDFGGVTLEEYVKDTIVSELATIKAMTILAKEYKVTLTSEEKENVKKAASTYYNSLSEEEISYMNVTESIVEDFYTEHVLANKVYSEITKDVDTEISDDDARIITVQQIFLKTYRIGEDGSKESFSQEEKEEVYAKAADILTQLNEGKEFLTLASIYNQEGQITESFGRDEKEDAYETVAFALENEQVSDVVETQNGYYIIKCVNNFDKEATEDNKTVMLEKRRDAVFGKVYDELIADTPSEFNKKLWEAVHFETREDSKAENFFDVYEQIF